MSDLGKIERDIGRLEAKVDILLARSESRDERIARLEHAQTHQKAVIGVVGTVAGGLSGFLLKFLGLT